MGSIDDIKSTLTQSALDTLCEKFHIPDTVHPELPGRNNRIRNVLEYFQINLSQLSVIATAKVSYFEILCRIHGFVPTVGNFLCDFLVNHPTLFRKFLESFLCLIGISRYYELDDNVYPVFLVDDDEEMDLFAFINHADPTKVQIREREVRDGEVLLLESTKGLLSRLVLLMVRKFPVDAGIVRIEDEVPATVVEKAKGSRKKRKTTGGASGSNLPPKKLRADHGTSSASASTGEKSVAALQGLLEHSTLPVEVGVTAVATLPFITSYVSLTPEREGGGRTDSVTGPNLRTHHPTERSLIMDPPIMTTAIATTIVASASSVSVAGAGNEPDHASIFEDFTSAGTLRGMNYDQLLTDFNVGAARQTCIGGEVRMQTEHIFGEKKKLKGRCSRQADLLKEKDAEIASLKSQQSLKEAEAAEAIRLRSQVATVEATEATRVNELNGLKERNSTLEEEKHVLEHKVAALESADAAKVIELTSLTAQIAKLTQDLSELGLSCDELSVKASFLEAERDRLVVQVSLLEGTCFELHDEVSGYKLFKEQIKAVQDEQVKVLTGRRWIFGRGLRLVVMKCLQSPEYLVALGGAIGCAIDKGMQDGLATGIDHGKARRGLVDVAAYDPSTEANYVSAVNALRAVDFPLLAQLASQKDASIADIMGLFHLDSLAAETPKADQLQPSLEQLMFPIHRPEDQVVIGETSMYFSLDVVHARVRRIRGDVASQRLSISDAMVPVIKPLFAENLVGKAITSGVSAAVAATTALSNSFVQASFIPPIPVSDYEVADTEAQVEASSSPKIIFDQETLKTSPDNPAT
ncbi:hypothetical protein Tco_0564103 [Tanacetum coccineum]